MFRFSAFALGVSLCVGWLPASPARAECLIFCADETETTGQKAKELFEADLGGPLPDGVTVQHHLEGGFQDRFVQVRLKATLEGGKALLGLLGTDPRDLRPDTAILSAPQGPGWWTPQQEHDLMGAEAKLGTFAYTSIGVAYDNTGLLTIYIFAFET